MTRTILVIATALLAVMTVFASAAEACISCSYVPPVVHTPSESYSVKLYSIKRIYRAATRRKARRSKRIVRRKTKAKKVQAAKLAPVKTKLKNENSTISNVSLDKYDAIETKTEEPEAPKVRKKTGCKKFFPTVGMTLTVPCE